MAVENFSKSGEKIGDKMDCEIEKDFDSSIPLPLEKNTPIKSVDYAVNDSNIRKKSIFLSEINCDKKTDEKASLDFKKMKMSSIYQLLAYLTLKVSENTYMSANSGEKFIKPNDSEK